MGAAGAAPAPKKSLFTRLADTVAGSPKMSLTIIIVLVILLIGGYIYYHGLWFLGPYAHGRPARAGLKRKNSDPALGGAEEPGGGAADKGLPADKDEGDPETERLIKSINKT
jgi:hypothetical protein